ARLAVDAMACTAIRFVMAFAERELFRRAEVHRRIQRGHRELRFRRQLRRATELEYEQARTVAFVIAARVLETADDGDVLLAVEHVRYRPRARARLHVHRPELRAGFGIECAESVVAAVTLEQQVRHGR